MDRLEGFFTAMPMIRCISLISIVILVFTEMKGQEGNQIDRYQGDLPEILKLKNGKVIKTIDDWRRLRRPQILKLFAQEVYGVVPPFDYSVDYDISAVNPVSLSGKATQKEVLISVKQGEKELKMVMLVFIPNDRQEKTPLFMGLNFYGNHAVNGDSNITLTKNYVINNKDIGITNNRSTQAQRGARSNSWPIEMIIDRGYGFATIHCGDIDPDFDDGFINGIHPFAYRKVKQKPKADEWGTIAAWSWGLSRALDYFEVDEAVDEQKVALIGHSRLGKAALWSGANDERFAMVISNNSGCGGAALSKRKFGETVSAINKQFPHWFCDNFNKYNDKEEKLPVDQHMLLSLIAPRPVYVASAKEDEWADPVGEYASLYNSSAVYELYGFETLVDENMPAIDEAVTKGKQGYHIRSGSHALTQYDWEQYLNFADKNLK